MCLFFCKEDIYVYRQKEKYFISKKQNDKKGKLVKEMHTLYGQKHGKFLKINHRDYLEKNYNLGILHGKCKLQKMMGNNFYELYGSYFYGLPHNVWYYIKNDMVYKKKYYYHGRLEKIESYYENGNKRDSSFYKNGKLNGFYILYYPNGNIKIESYFTNNKKNGFTMFYQKNNVLHSVVSFKNNKINGDFIKYYPNRKIMCITSYKNGLREGTETVYDEEGNVMIKREYYKNKSHGNTLLYNIEGNITEYQYHQNGKMLFSKGFDPEIKEECCICFEETNFQLKCNHTVCVKCSEKINRCPVCRRFIIYL